MKKVISLLLVLVTVLVLAGCQKEEPTILDLEPYLDDFQEKNPTIRDCFQIPANLPMDFFEFKATGTTLDGVTVDLFEGKELTPGKSVAFDNPENLKEIHVEVNVILSGDSLKGIVWDIDLINNRTAISR